MVTGYKVISFANPSFICKTSASTFCSYTPNQQQPFSSITKSTKTQFSKTDVYFKTLGNCKLGISIYPDFVYNAEGGAGTGTWDNISGTDINDNIPVSFDLKTLYIPPLTSATTKFLGLPLPPFLKIDIEPQLLQGSINPKSGNVDLEFIADFWFSVGSLYKAPPLLVKTVLTSEEVHGKMRNGKGERLDNEGKCRLVGVAIVDPIDDFLMNSFLALPTECLADLNAVISFSTSSS